MGCQACLGLLNLNLHFIRSWDEATLESFAGWNDTETLLVSGASRAEQAGKCGLSEKAVESHEKILSIRSDKKEGTVILGMRCGTGCLRGSPSLSCRYYFQQPACCSSWTCGRTAVTSCSLSCIPPTAWASVPLQTYTPAPTSCSRLTPTQVRQGDPRFP